MHTVCLLLRRYYKEDYFRRRHWNAWRRFPLALSLWQDSIFARAHRIRGVMGSSVCNSRFCVNLFARVRAGQNLIELDCPDAENASFFHHDRGAASLQKMDVEHCLQLVFLGRDEIFVS
jgi:hypothetical protein